MSVSQKSTGRVKRSREGCLQCKKRRKKCDEAKPICGSCKFRNMDCNYPDCQPPRKSSNGESGEGPSQSAGAAQISENRVTLRRQPTPTPLDSLDMTSLKLFHHYIFITSDTLSCTGSLQRSLKFTVPQFAFSNPCLMHGMLAIASFHMHYLVPYADENWSDLALSQKTQLTLSLKTETTHPDVPYLTQSFLRIYQYASTATASYLDVLSWISSIYQGFWARRKPSQGWTDQDLSINIRHGWVDLDRLGENSNQNLPFPDSLRRIHLPLSDFPDPEEVEDPETADAYKVASHSLSDCWILSQRPGSELAAVSSWPVRFTEKFHQFLVLERRPRALTLLYYYCFMLCCMKNQGNWWLGGLANSVDYVRLMLDERWMACIDRNQSYLRE